MEKNYSNERPQLYTRDAGNEHTRTINFGIEEHPGDENRFSFYSVKVKVGQWDYDGIVNAIVSAEYPADRMQAIQNNFLRALRGDAGAKSGDYLEEFNDMQNWRDLAKATAHEVLGQ